MGQGGGLVTGSMLSPGILVTASSEPYWPMWPGLDEPLPMCRTGYGNVCICVTRMPCPCAEHIQRTREYWRDNAL